MANEIIEHDKENRLVLFNSIEKRVRKVLNLHETSEVSIHSCNDNTTCCKIYVLLSYGSHVAFCLYDEELQKNAYRASALDTIVRIRFCDACRSQFEHVFGQIPQSWHKDILDDVYLTLRERDGE